MTTVKSSLPPLTLAEIERHSCKWRLENGGKHYRLMIDDQFVTIISRSSRDTDHCTDKNTRAQVRRFFRGHK